MPESKKSTSPKQIIDVTHADKAAPSDTSRPVIVTNRPILKDPMMSSEVPATPKDEPAPKKEPLQATGKQKLKPIEAPVADAVESDQPKQSEPETTPEPTAEPASKPEPAKSDEPEESNAPAKTPDADADIAASKRAEHEAAMQKLIEAKQYFLPINAVEKRRSKRFVISGVILSVILLAFWADVALDAGLVHVGGVKAVTHFFSN